MYKKIKKQKGEKFAQTLRNFHNGIFEIPDLDVILRHAGRQAEPLLPYLMHRLSTNDNEPPSSLQKDPFILLDQAGYKAFHADTLEKQNSIKPYFKKGELLCTFNDHARYKNYHMVHAVKKNADQIKREDFNGKEQREDAYGTSVISIQMLKSGGFISIKNRYNHSVASCDNTFKSNPDHIIDGLSEALKTHFNVEFSTTVDALPNGYTTFSNQVFKYHFERHNIYYGDQAWVENGKIHDVNRAAGDALFNGFIFDNKTKTLRKIDPAYKDSFADDFNRCYGGNNGLYVDKNANLMLKGEILIGAEHSQIKTLNLPELTSMSEFCLCMAHVLTEFNAPSLTSMGGCCLYYAGALTEFNVPKLTAMGERCFYNACALTEFNAPKLAYMGERCLFHAPALTKFNAPKNAMPQTSRPSSTLNVIP